MNYPEIRFQNSYLLIGTIYPDIKTAYESSKEELDKLDSENIAKKLDEYKNAWRPYEEKIIHGMCEILDLEFYQNTIDVFAAPFYNSFSSPMFLTTKYDPDRAIDVLTHEILHRLLTDNTKVRADISIIDMWSELFGKNHSWNTLVHIPVHATLQAIFEDVLNEPKRKTRDIKMCENNNPYKKAWEYVEKNGYKTIIAQLRKSYDKLCE